MESFICKSSVDDPANALRPLCPMEWVKSKQSWGYCRSSTLSAARSKRPGDRASYISVSRNYRNCGADLHITCRKEAMMANPPMPCYLIWSEFSTNLKHWLIQTLDLLRSCCTTWCDQVSQKMLPVLTPLLIDLQFRFQKIKVKISNFIFPDGYTYASYTYTLKLLSVNDSLIRYMISEYT